MRGSSGSSFPPSRSFAARDPAAAVAWDDPDLGIGNADMTLVSGDDTLPLPPPKRWLTNWRDRWPD